MTQDRIALGALVFDAGHRMALIDGMPLDLPRRELLVLEALILRAGRVVAREALEQAVYGYDDDIASNTLDFLAKDLETVRAFLRQVLCLVYHQLDTRMLQEGADFPPKRGNGAAFRPDAEGELVHDDFGTAFTGRYRYEPGIRVRFR